MQKDNAKKVCNKILWYGFELPYWTVFVLSFIIMLFNFQEGVFFLLISIVIVVIIAALEMGVCWIYITHLMLSKKR